MTHKHNFPNLFVPGFAKSGTSHLCKMLSKSRDIYLPSEKEPHHFSEDLIPDDIKIGQSSYLDLYSKSGAKYRLDGSISYMYSRVAFSNIVSSCESPRFIVLVRHPFDRMVSHYRFNVRNGVEKRAFPEALKNTELLKSQWVYEYQEMSDYKPQMASLLDSLEDSSQVRLVDYEEYQKKPEEIIGRIADYLGVKIPIDGEISEKVNVSKKPKYRVLNDLMVVDTAWKRTVKSCLPFSLRRRVKKFVHNKNISDNDVEYLEDSFTDQLRSELDQDFKDFKVMYRELYI